MKKLFLLILLSPVSILLTGQSGRTEILQELERTTPALQEKELTATLKQASRLFELKDDLTSVIMVLPAGTKVKVTGSDSDYYKVQYEDAEGYILKRHAEIEMTQPEVSQAKRDADNSVREQTVQPEREMTRLEYLQKKYGPRLAAQINAGKIWKGMTAQMVQDSWGKPQKINRSISGNLIREEWIYMNTWLYIENNTLMNWGPIRK